MGIPGSPNALLMRRAAVSEEAEAYLLKNSLRINDNDTPHLDRDFGTGNRRKWTVSFWVKRGALGLGVNNAEYVIFSTSCTSTACNAIFQFYNDDAFSVFVGYIGAKNLRTNRKFTDVGSWYHFVISFEAGASDNTERMRIWVNGLEETSFAADDRSGMTDTDWGISIAQNHRIGNNGNNNRSFDGLISDFHFIDGQAIKSPAAFGEFDVTGVWNPKKFAMPTPNTGVTWSGMMTSETGSWYSSSNVNLFNGILGQGSAGQTASASAEDKWIKFTPTGGLKFKQSIRVQHWPGGNSPYLQVKYTLKLTDGREIVLDVASSNSSNGFFTLFEGNGTIEYIQQVCSNNQFNNWGGLEIDGVLLVDSQTNQAEYHNPHGVVNGDFEARLTSNATGGTEGFWGNGPGHGHWKQYGFDGSLTTETAAADGDKTLTLTFNPALKWSRLIEFNNSDQSQVVGINGTTVLDGSGTAGWQTISRAGGSLTTLTFTSKNTGIDDTGRFRAIRIDGQILLQDQVDNSFRLAFDDTTRTSAIGKDTLNGKISDATGGKPILVTTDDWGDITEGAVDTSDSNKASLKLALPMKSDFKSYHGSINGNSGNDITASTNSGVSINTSQSRFYGASAKFANGNVEFSASNDYDFDGDFCIEVWLRKTDNTNKQIICDGRSGGSTGYMLWVNDSGTIKLSLDSDESSEVIAGSVNIKNNKWYHVAVTRNGSGSNNVKMFLDGANIGQATNTSSLAGGGIKIGERQQGISMNYFAGFMNDFRLYKGASVYSVSFKPPIRGDFNPTNLSLEGGTPYSSYWGGSGSTGNIDNGGNAFNGNTSNYASNQNSNTICNWVPPSGIAYSDLEIKFGAINNGNNQVYINGNVQNVTNSGGQTYTDSNGTLTSVGVQDTGSTHGRIFYIKINGSYLVDGYVYEKDILTDSPTSYLPDGGTDATGGVTRGNYPTWSPWHVQTAPTGAQYYITLSEANMKCTLRNRVCAITQSIPAGGGKYYFEYSVIGSGSDWWVCGICPANSDFNSLSYPMAFSNLTGGVEYGMNGRKRVSSTTTNSWGSSYTYGDVIGVALDFSGTTGKVWFSKIGTGTSHNWQASGNPVTGANPCADNLAGDYIVACNDGGGNETSGEINFGQRAFKAAAPTGYSCLCSQNLPDTFGANSNANEDKNNPSKYFDVMNWSGTSSNRTLTDLNFQPELAWIKCRSDSSNHRVFDAIRGSQKSLRTHLNNQEDSTSEYGYVSAFTSKGVTLTNGSNSGNPAFDTNESGETYVGFFWDAGTSAGTPISTGDITPNHVWKNRDAGFSITEYSGSGSDHSVPHDLGAKPDLLFVKKTNAAGEWRGWHSHLGAGKGIDLNNSDGEFSDTSFTQEADANYIYVKGSVGNVNNSGNTYMLYAWTAIKGYSAFGGYDGSDQDRYIHTGFQPRWLMIKLYSEDINHGGWKIIDTNRDPINDGAVCQKISADLGEQENGNTQISSSEGDIFLHSNGFIITDNHAPFNTNGRSYLYAAFAEFPGKTARAR